MDSLMRSKYPETSNCCCNIQTRRVHGQLLKNAFCGLTFSQDVIRERAAQNTRYSQTDFSRLFQASGVLGTRTTFTKNQKRRSSKYLWPSQVNLRTHYFGWMCQQGALFDSVKTGSQTGSNRCSPLKKEPVRKTMGRAKSSQCEEFKLTPLTKTTSQCLTKHPLHSLQRHQHTSISATNLTGEKSVCDEDSCSSEQHTNEHQKRTPRSTPPVDYSVPDFYTPPQARKDKLTLASASHEVCCSESTSKMDGLSVSRVKGAWHGVPVHVRDTEAAQLQPWHVALPEHSRLCYTMQEWSRAWNIKTPGENGTIEGLNKALTDLHCHVRLVAVATCALWAVNTLRTEKDAIAVGHRPMWTVQLLTKRLTLLRSAMDDPVKEVQMAAALCHYAMRMPNNRAREILRDAVHKDSTSVGADSWAAAQCLADEGDCSQAVIQRLLSQHFLGWTAGDREQAEALLVSLSKKTTLVRSLLAEQLNCANWRYKVQACSTISRLSGPLNKDVVNKLLYLMWNDWSNEVRQAAAQALGKLGMAREVHNELRVKLEDGPPSWRVEALNHLAQLRIMTARLLPGFLGCLRDSSKAVRKQACITAAALPAQDQRVLNELTDLMQNDPAWDVKVEAINALGRIGCLTSTLQKHLFWALHHEKEPEVQIAACEAIAALGVSGQELQNLLEERYVLEPHPQVKRHIERLIKNYGYSLEGDTGMLHKIKQHMQKLCTKHTITEKVLLMEDSDDMWKQQQCMLGEKGHPYTVPVTRLLKTHYNEMTFASLTNLSSAYSQDPQSTSCDKQSKPKDLTKNKIKLASITK